MRKHIILYSALVACLLLLSCKKEQEQSQETVTAKQAIPVKTEQIGIRHFEDKVRVQGSLRAKHSADVSPRLDGTIEELCVDKGSRVEKGKTKLFVIDKVNVERKVSAARQELAALKQSLLVAQASAEKVGVEAKKAKIDQARYARLFQQGQATANELELYTTQLEAAEADMKYAMASAEAIAEKIKVAEIELKIAEKHLEDCTVYAPISGYVCEKYMELGEMADTSHPVVKIYDTDTVEAVAHIPAQYYSNVAEGQTKIRLSLDGKFLGEYPVTYRSPIINDLLRTFEIKVLMQGDGEKGIVPGAMAEIELVLISKEALAVPTHSILTRSKGNIVFLAKAGRAIPCGVRIGLQGGGYTEIAPAPLGEGAAVPEAGAVVISEGQYMLSDNDPIAE